MSSRCEFALSDTLAEIFDDHDATPLMRRGMTSVETINYLRREFPDQKDWFWWDPSRTTYDNYLTHLVQRPDQREGKVDEWSWQRRACSYPEVFYWTNDPKDKRHRYNWTGAIEVRGPDGERFVLFSYLSSAGRVGQFYFVSTPDLKAAHRFGQAVEMQMQPGRNDSILIHTTSGPDVTVNFSHEPIYLADAMQDDIEEQCLSFFKDRELYSRLQVPYKRGFLFVGYPGTGKTMMIRNLLRKVCARHKNIVVSAVTGSHIDEELLGSVMSRGEVNLPSILILEELDSLANQSGVKRGGLLTQLDGLEPHEGLMVLATTNNPGEVDPALMHRPSRFDRVWRFELPDVKLRRRYLGDKFKECSAEVLDKLARTTNGWTFAYINELRVTAGVVAIRDYDGKINDGATLKAHRLLAVQYEAGRKNHMMETTQALGFNVE
ncbi:MAG: ATP-binding protein [Lentisphaerae bacterium]|nr:ATP-binding protein [Lentisphaerota bacterium]